MRSVRMWQLWERSSIMRIKRSSMQAWCLDLGHTGRRDTAITASTGIISAIWEDSAMHRMYLR